MVFATFRDRLAAKLIDLFLLAICLLPFDIAFGTSLILQRGAGQRFGALQKHLYFCYSGLTPRRWRARSSRLPSGRGLWGVVTDSRGDRISLGKALLRSGMQCIWIGWLLIPFTGRSQALHDLIADTQVTPGTL